MPLAELMSFTNSAVLILSFALLLIVLSFSISNVNSVSVFANAQAVASAIGSRLITSPNCFAYQQTDNYMTNIAGKQTIMTESNTEPGVIDVSKMAESSFLSCVQYDYSPGASQVPFSQDLVPAFAGVSATIVDTQNPMDLSPGGAVSVSNFNQLNYGSAFTGTEQVIAQDAQIAEYAAFLISIPLSIGVQAIPPGIFSGSLIFAVGSNNYNSINPQYASSSIFYSEDTYTESFPVILQFTDANHNPLYQDSGVMYVTIHYLVAPQGTYV